MNKTRRHPQVLTNDQVKQIAREYGRTKGATEFSEEFGVTRQRIQQVAHNLRSHGVDIPKMKDWKYFEIVNELRKESPELFKGGDKK